MKQHIKLLTLFLSFVIFQTTCQSEQPFELYKRINVEQYRYVVVPMYEEPYWQNFVVEYQEDENLDLRLLDNSQLSIPYIMCTIPYVWASGKTYTVPVMDEDLYYSLEKIQQVYRLFFPFNSWSGKLIPKELKKNKLYGNAQKTALLFSGGLDALSASFGHIDNEQFLITICGNDIHIHDFAIWNTVKEQCKQFAQTYKHTNAFIRSTFRMFDKGNIFDNFCPQITRPWHEALTALGLTGLTAPLLIAKGYSTLHLGATRTIECPYPFGTHPLLDNNISFAGIQVFHDQADFNRVDKIRFIDQQVKKYNLSYPELRVCFTKRLQEIGGKNCSKCEKCLRTINEIVVLGIDPEPFGFIFNEASLISKTKALLKGKRLSEGEIWHWQCVQQEIKNAPADRWAHSSALQDYFSWLASLDVTKLYMHEIKKLESIQEKKPFSTKLWELGQRGASTIQDLLKLTS